MERGDPDMAQSLDKMARGWLNARVDSYLTRLMNPERFGSRDREAHDPKEKRETDIRQLEGELIAAEQDFHELVSEMHQALVDGGYSQETEDKVWRDLVPRVEAANTKQQELFQKLLAASGRSTRI